MLILRRDAIAALCITPTPLASRIARPNSFISLSLLPGMLERPLDGSFSGGEISAAEKSAAAWLQERRHRHSCAPKSFHYRRRHVGGHASLPCRRQTNSSPDLGPLVSRANMKLFPRGDWERPISLPLRLMDDPK